MRALAVPLLAAGCVGGVTPVQCAIDSDCSPDSFCLAGTCYSGTHTCPTPTTFSGINSTFLQVGCGVNNLNCHSADSANVSSGPSFAGHPYRTLVGAQAKNRLGTATDLILVKPNDPDNSFLLIKLRITSPPDPAFGPGQPADAPGTTCDGTLAAIKQWILSGAPDN